MKTRAGPKPQANPDSLIKIGLEADLTDGTGFADLQVNGHRETWPIRSKGFRRWLGKRYFELTRSAPSAAAVGAALNVIEARAQFEGPSRSVHVRVAGTDDRIYLDLADEAWRCVEIAATNGHVLAFDNVSGLPYWLSDTLCRLAAGGGFATRQLYTDSEEVLFDAVRPIILNGIEDMISRPDLADRAIFLSSGPISETRVAARNENCGNPSGARP